MGKQVSKWLSDDGIEFDTKKEMLLHELSLLDEKEINIFIEDIYDCPSRQKKSYKKSIIAWQKYQRELDMKDVVEEVQVNLINEGWDVINEDLSATIKEISEHASPIPLDKLSEEEKELQEIEESFEKAPKVSNISDE